VYLFRGREGSVLYVGRSRHVRRRVKSYFYGDGRKKVEDLLAATTSVEALACATDVEARALEARLIRRHEPRFNRQGRTWRRYAYVKLDLDEAYPRLKIVRRPRGSGVFLGPFASSSAARLAEEALEEVVPLRRCTAPMRAATRFAPCALADMGRCLAPCDGRVGPERYGESVRALVSSLSNPDRLLGALEAGIAALARAERFEEAALARDRVRALAEALRRGRLDRWLVGAGRLVVRDRTGSVRFAAGSLVRDGEEPDPLSHPPPRERADELAAVRSWLAASDVRLEAADRAPAEPVAGGAALHRLLDRLRAADRADASREGASTANR
jgi:DNA polymerase-3 subunit epsilon